MRGTREERLAMPSAPQGATFVGRKSGRILMKAQGWDIVTAVLYQIIHIARQN